MMVTIDTSSFLKIPLFDKKEILCQPLLSAIILTHWIPLFQISCHKKAFLS